MLQANPLRWQWLDKSPLASIPHVWGPEGNTNKTYFTETHITWQDEPKAGVPLQEAVGQTQSRCQTLAAALGLPDFKDVVVQSKC